MLTIQGPGEQHLAVGGGSGRYVVYATFDNCDFLNLLAATVDDGSVLLNAGGQEGDYSARQIVDLTQAEKAARAFFAGLRLDPRLPSSTWLLVGRRALRPRFADLGG